MKTLVLNGGRTDRDGTDAVQALLIEELEAAGCEVRAVVLRNESIDTCKGCFGCWTATPGTCWIADAGRAIAEAVVRSELTVLLTPVTFGGYSSQLKKVIDRLIPIISPLFMRIDGETRHRPRYPHYPRLLGLGVMAEGDAENERIFKTLVGRNAVNFHCPAHAAGGVSPGGDEQAVRRRIRALLEEAGGAK